MANFTLTTDKAGRGFFAKPSPRHGEQGAKLDDTEERSVMLYDALSDDGPFRRLTEKEAHRHVVYACCYYFVLAAGILAATLWR